MVMLFIKGFLNNILITIGSCILPMIVGVVACIVCNKNEQLSKLAYICGTFFESLCPIITILVMCYCVFPTLSSTILVCIIGFSISFLGYMPRRFNSKYSLFKNVIVNGIGLVSSIFKWSFCASYIGAIELLHAARAQWLWNFDSIYLWIALIISFAIIFVLEMMKFIAKEKL